MKNLLYTKIKLSLNGIKMKKFVKLIKKRIKMKKKKKRLLKLLRKIKKNLQEKKKIINKNCIRFLKEKRI